MGLNHSPKIATTGLLFAYDAGNTQKSWKGAPVTNLVPNPYANWNGSNIVLNYNYDGSGGQVYSYVPNVSNPVDAPGVMQYTVGTAGYKYWSIASTIATTGTHTFSYYARIVNGPAITSNINNAQLWRSNGVDQAVTGDWNPTYTTSWARYSTTGPCTAATVLDYFPIHNNPISGGYTIQYCGFQLELGTYATPFAAGTRSNAQALLDLTRRTTMTASNLVYNSNNIFNFSYSGPSYITVPLSTAFNKTEGTMNFWVYPTRYNGGNGYFVNREDNTANAGDWFWIGPYSNTFYFRIGTGATCCDNDLSFSNVSTTIPIDTWTNMCFTWRINGTSVIYKNGVELVSRSIGNIPNTNPAANGRIGLGHANADDYFDGRMPIVQIYNRQLTATEVNSNFNAMRGRYGI